MASDNQINDIIEVCGKSHWSSIKNIEICPNSTTQSECNGFYCNVSQSCIKQEQKCDGIVHCLNAEDENFDECHNTFKESATIECRERNRASKFNITIKATPCNEERECEDKDDEDCEKNNRLIYSLLFCAFVLIAIICYSVRYSVHYSIKRRQQDVVIASASESKIDDPISDEAIRSRQVVHTFYVFSDHY